MVKSLRSVDISSILSNRKLLKSPVFIKPYMSCKIHNFQLQSCDSQTDSNQTDSASNSNWLRPDTSSLKLFLLNSRSINNKLNQFQNFVYSNKVDIFVLLKPGWPMQFTITKYFLLITLFIAMIVIVEVVVQWLSSIITFVVNLPPTTLT